jgi:hypothetical protein
MRFYEEADMKKSVLLLSLLFVFTSITLAQEMIENPDKPLSNKAGRILKLKEVLRIGDVGDEYYFRFPTNLKVSPNGSIFIQEIDQLLHFDQNGKFVRNYFKKGRGPGEMGYVINYCFHDGNIIIQSSVPYKILWFGLNGKLITEFRIHEQAIGSKFLFFYNDVYYFLKSARSRPEKTAIVEVPQNLISLASNEKEIKKLSSFTVKKYVEVGKRGGAVIYPVNYLINIPYRKKYLFISHTMEYLVKLFDFEENRIIRTFRRKYKKIKTPRDAGKEKRGGATMDGKVVIPPTQKYLSDIQNLFIYRDNLWVITSMKDEERRTLIDEYSFEGKYIDSYYIKFPDRIVRDRYALEPVVIRGNFLYALEKNEDESYEISKYSIEDKN